MFKRLSVPIAAMLISGVGLCAGSRDVHPAYPDGKPDFSGVWQTGGISLTGGLDANIVPAKPAAPPAAPLPPAGAVAPPSQPASMRRCRRSRPFSRGPRKRRKA